MRQVLHVFGKDVRHHWYEIAVSLALLVGFCWFEIDSWTHPGYFAIADSWFMNRRTLAALTDWLLPMSWLLLVIRVVHDESLVGDRQFWITRPYDWRSLLAAKLLFIAVTVNLPLLIAHVLLLAKAGFNPFNYIAGLLYLQLLIVAILICSAFVLATVTRTLWQTALAALAVVLYMILGVSLDSLVPNSAFYSGSDFLQGILFWGTAAVVIVLQYSRRRTFFSWELIGALGIVILGFLVLPPYRLLIDREFPRLQSSVPFQLQLVSPTGEHTGAPVGRDEVQIELPFDISGQGPESIFSIRGFRAELFDGTREEWTSEWRQTGAFVLPGLTRVEFSFSMPRKVYDRLKSRKLTIRLSAAVLEYRDANRHDIVLPGGEFRFADAGLCVADRQISCHAPLRGPRFLLVRSDPAASTCPPPAWASKDEPKTDSKAWSDFAWAKFQEDDSAPATMGLSAIRDLNFYFTLPGNAAYAGVCPGSHVTLSNPHFIRQFQSEWSWNGFQVSDYSLKAANFTIVP